MISRQSLQGAFTVTVAGFVLFFQVKTDDLVATGFGQYGIGVRCEYCSIFYRRCFASAGRFENYLPPKAVNLVVWWQIVV